jgi:hypothetical protein
MIVVTDRIKVGRMGEHDIFRLKDYRIMPFSRNYLALSEAQVTNDRSTDCEPTDKFSSTRSTCGKLESHKNVRLATNLFSLDTLAKL